MSFVADYSIARPGGATIRAAGATGVVRYTGDYRYDGAIITADEYRDLIVHGLAVALVMEYSASWTSQGYAYGKALAIAARNKERAIGIPDGVTYAATDWDVTLGGPPVSPEAIGNCAKVRDTMQGMADGYGGWEYVGAYGSKYLCDWLLANSPCRRFWSTQAWSNYIPMGSAGLYQYAGWPAGIPYIAGCDYNEVRGDYAPRVGGVIPTPNPTPTPTPGDIVSQLVTVDLNQQWRGDAPILRQIRGLLESWNIKVGGKLINPDNASGADTRTAVATFQRNCGLKADLIVGPKTWGMLLFPVLGGHFS